MVAIVTLAKDCIWCNDNNPTIKQFQTIAVKDENHAPTNNFEPEPF
jgi:hypothetical protein